MLKDPLTIKIVAACLFVLTYALLLIFAKKRAYIALASATLFVILGIVPIGKVFGIINWNILLMLLGTMGLVALFIESRMPAAIGDMIINRTPNVKWAIVLLSFLSGIISAFIDNVATVLMIAPIAVTICKKLDISPVPAVIAIAISSNLQGAATLVGDTTSILLGAQANMNFFDFFVFQGKTGLFWIVQASAILATLMLVFVFRKQNQKLEKTDITKVTDAFPGILLLLMIALLIGASFIPDRYKLSVTNGLICTALFIAGIIRFSVKRKDKKTASPDPQGEACPPVSGQRPLTAKKAALGIFKEIDYITLLLLAGLFIVVAGLTESGLVDEIARFLAGISGNVFVIYTILVFASVIISGFIDNIPYVAAMLPVAAGIAAAMGIEPYVLYFGLVSGATLGGNLTPIGASANIAGLGILRKEGHEVKTWDFMKISVPFTLIAVLTGYLLIWVIY